MAARSSRGAAAAWAAVLGCAALSLATHRLAFGSFFSPDDLILLERARGIAPAPSTLWRFLSGRLYFASVVPFFGSDARPYLLVNGLLHALNVVLLGAWVRRAGGGWAAAILAAGLFGTSRLFFSVIAQATGIGDLLALTFTLIACLAIARPGAAATAAATAAFAAALLSKENVVLLPLALLLVPAIGPTVRDRLRRIAPLVLVGAAWTAYLAGSGIRSTALGGPAYEIDLGLHLVRNAASYATWIVDLTTPSPDVRAGLADAKVGAVVIVILLVVAATAWRRTRLPLVGLTWWGLALMPVLPLIWQRHAHYLYAPAAGFAAALGGVLEALFSPGGVKAGSARVAAVGGVVAGLLIVGHAAHSSRLIEERVRRVLALPDVQIPEDPFVRKAELIRRVTHRVSAAIGDRRARIVFIAPRVEGTTQFFAGLLPSLFDHGRGLRALFPGVDSVAFVERWTPGYKDFELMAGTTDGFVLPFGRGPGAHLRFAEALALNGYEREARIHLDDAIAAYPDDPRLRRARAAADSLARRARS